MATKTRQKKEMRLKLAKEKVDALDGEVVEIEKAVQDAFQGLTIKMQKFVRMYAETGNGTEAAMYAYDYDDDKRGPASTKSWQLLKKDSVQNALSEYMAIMASKNFCLSRFHMLASSAKSQDTQLRATTELAKINGMYNDSNAGRKDVQIIQINLPSLSQLTDNVVDTTATHK